MIRQNDTLYAAYMAKVLSQRKNMYSKLRRSYLYFKSVTLQMKKKRYSYHIRDRGVGRYCDTKEVAAAPVRWRIKSIAMTLADLHYRRLLDG